MPALGIHPLGGVGDHTIDQPPPPAARRCCFPAPRQRLQIQGALQTERGPDQPLHNRKWGRLRLAWQARPCCEARVAPFGVRRGPSSLAGPQVRSAAAARAVQRYPRFGDRRFPPYTRQGCRLVRCFSSLGKSVAYYKWRASGWADHENLEHSAVSPSLISTERLRKASGNKLTIVTDLFQLHPKRDFRPHWEHHVSFYAPLQSRWLNQTETRWPSTRMPR